MPSSSATIFTGGGCSFARMRPLVPLPSGSDSGFGEPTDVSRILLPELGPLRQCGSTLEDAEIVDEQFPMQVIDLVLQAARQELGSANFDGISVAIERPHDDACRALDVAEHVWNRQTAFLAHDGAFA